MLILVVMQMIVFLSDCFAKDLTTNMPKCHAGDPKMGECIAKAANELRPHIRTGLNELGMPSFTPLLLSPFKVNQVSNLVNYTIEVWNYSVRGLDNYDITEITFNPENMTFKVTLQFDPVLVKAGYIFSGSLIQIPVEGAGTVEVSWGPLNGTIVMNGNMIKRKNVDHYNPKNLEVKLTIEDMSVHFDGLFNNNTMLGELTNNMLNKNSELLARAVAPAIEVVTERFIMKYFKWLTKTFSYYQLFPH